MRIPVITGMRCVLAASTAIFFAALPLQVDLTSASIDTSTAVAAGGGGQGGGGGGGQGGGGGGGQGGGSAGAAGANGAAGAGANGVGVQSNTTSATAKDPTASVQDVVGTTPGAGPSTTGLATASENVADEARVDTPEEIAEAAEEESTEETEETVTTE
jgi:hypothetical protein